MFYIDKEGDLFINAEPTNPSQGNGSVYRVYLHEPVTLGSGYSDVLSNYMIGGRAVRVDTVMLKKLLTIVNRLSSEDSVELSKAIESLYHDLVLKEFL